jgi:hypothetical protein
MTRSVIDVVSGTRAAVIAATAIAIILGGLWLALPLALRGPPDPPAPSRPS